MFYIGVNQAVHPPTGTLDGNAIFAIICVYLFVVFYSFGWGPTPFILSSECAPNHLRSLVMAAALMFEDSRIPQPLECVCFAFAIDEW